MKQSPFLKPGDTVAIISTARKINRSELIFATRFLEEQGYQVVYGKSIGIAHYQFAGTDKERIQDFQKAIDNPDIKAIWCARGGYGTVRIIDEIDFKDFLKSPKWIIGYSDITVLHSKINSLDRATIHGPMAFDLEKCSTIVQNNFAKILKGAIPSLSFSNDTYNRFGNAEGLAVGGNLSVLYSLCGSPNAIDTNGKILFLEDLDEYVYHVDRMFQNLKRNGYLENLAALVIGGMTHMHDNTTPFGYSVKEIILEATVGYDYPIVFNAPFGHVKENQPVAFGSVYEIEMTEEKVVLKPKATL